jgi:Omp85 superfamily domain
MTLTLEFAGLRCRTLGNRTAACLTYLLYMSCLGVAVAGEPETKKSGSWATGMESTTLAMPAMPAMPGTLGGQNSVEPATTDKRGEWLAVPIPRVDPALGTGLIGAGAYIFKLDPQDNESPPSIVGAAGMWMDKGSWGGGLGTKLYFREDRFRLMAGVVYADLRYDLVTTSTTTDAELRLPLSQEGYGGITHAQFRVAANTYLGARVQIGKLGTDLRPDNPADLPESIADDLDEVLQVNSLAATFAYDSRDNNYYPRHGIAFDAGVDAYFRGLGSEVSFNRYELNYRHYRAVREHDVLALQAYLCAVDNDPPFFLQCQVGPNSLLRGYSFGEHRGDAMGALQAEYRWQFHPRWITAAYAGVAQVAPAFGDFAADENLYAGGIGLRYVIEPENGVTLRIDYAVGNDDDAFYVSVGEAF